MTDTMSLGDQVEIECNDGAWFSGVLMWVHPDYIVINGCGFARAGIKAVHAC